MPHSDIQQPVFKPDVSFKPKLRLFEERVTIVHCTYVFPVTLQHAAIRIWPTTYLVQEDGKEKKLLQAFNITPFPEWKLVNSGHRFTLIFEGLDKECKVFDLVENIPEPGGFEFRGIQRNQSDVYWIEIN